MPFYRFGCGVAHIRMTVSKKHPAPRQCRAPHVWPDGVVRPCRAIALDLCDAPVGFSSLCSMPICPEHRAKDGVLDYCPKHAAERGLPLPAKP